MVKSSDAGLGSCVRHSKARAEVGVEVEPEEEPVSKLSQREQQLADFVENAVVGLHWVGADGRIIWANQAELDLLGYAQEE